MRYETFTYFWRFVVLTMGPTIVPTIARTDEELCQEPVFTVILLPERRVVRGAGRDCRTRSEEKERAG